MTDKDKELIKRLRDFGHVDAYQAATRIEDMSRELDMKSSLLSMRTISLEQATERAASAEAKLAKAVKALRFYANLQEFNKKAYVVLSELGV